MKSRLTILISLLGITLIQAEVKEVKPAQKDASPARVFFTNGDHFTIDSATFLKPDVVTLHSDALNEPISVSTSDLLTIIRQTTPPPSPLKTVANIKLVKRFNKSQHDTYIGEFVQITPESIIIKPDFSDQITINKSMVDSFKIQQQGAGCYYGPSSLDEWTTLPANTQWTFQKGLLVSKKKSSIWKNVGLTPNFHLNMRIKNSLSPSFSFRFNTGKPASGWPKTGFNLSFSRSHISYNAYGEKNIKDNAFITKSHRVNWDAKNEYIDIDLFVNTDDEMMFLFIDQKQVFAQKITVTEKLEEWISFHSSGNTPLEIKSIEINPWKGLDPNLTAKSTSKSEESILLLNGDEVKGVIGAVTKDTLPVQTKYTAIDIPIQRIKSLNLGLETEQPIMKSQDARIYLHNGSVIVIKLSEMTESYIAGYGQAVGDIKINLDAIRRIDLNIYDDTLNDLRETSY